MPKIIGVNFRNVGKVYYFDPGELDCRLGDHVIVETSRGKEYGKVVMGTQEMPGEKIRQPLKGVLRKATEEDDRKAASNREKEREAYRVCVQKIRDHELEMKLIDVEYSFDNNKILFYFTADGRIDFRQLVKDLASVFKTRIELRQIGVRDETKILGGIGICGRPLCCHTYLSDFVPVSIRMAKEQNLSLNQTKISGVCGRLMCCLKNEQETYEELNSRLPSLGEVVTMPDGLQGIVQSVNVLRQLVKVAIETEDEKEIMEYPVEDLSFRPRKKKGKGGSKEKDTAAAREEKAAENPAEDESPKPEKPEKEIRKNKEKAQTEHKKKDRKEKTDKTDRKERPEKPEKTDRPERPEVKAREQHPARGEGHPQVERRRRDNRRGNRSERRTRYTGKTEEK